MFISCAPQIIQLRTVTFWRSKNIVNDTCPFVEYLHVEILGTNHLELIRPSVPILHGYFVAQQKTMYDWCYIYLIYHFWSSNIIVGNFVAMQKDTQMAH